MSINTEPRSGMKYGWATGAVGWGDDVNANFARSGRFGFHLSVIDRDLTSPPAEPSHGAAYIVAVTATGAWEGQEDNIAVWDDDAGESGDWVFGTPRTGWVAYVEDEGKLAAFVTGTGWTAGVDMNPA